MRIYQILHEGVNKYKPMFAALYPKGIPQKIIDEIRYYENVFKREDRVTWVLRWVRADVAESLYNGLRDDDPTKQAVGKVLERCVKEISDKRLSGEQVTELCRSFYNCVSEFEHFFSLPINDIQRYVFKKQLPSEIIDAFLDMEQEWKESREHVVDRELRDEEIIDFGNGWAWFNLNRPYCDKEGDAMGHCGNSAAWVSGDQVLSLRQKVSDTEWSPHVTFILDGNNYIGEMKGRGNEKPVEKYHGMIMALLLNPIIKGIKGGGYRPENNFSTDDLPQEDQDRLLKQKPSLAPLIMLVNDNSVPEDILKTAMKANLSYFRYDFLDMESRDIVINRYTSARSYAEDQCYSYLNNFDRLCDAITDVGDNGDVYADRLEQDYFEDFILKNFYKMVHYELEVSLRKNKNDIEEILDFRSFAEALDNASRDEGAMPDSLDRTYDGGNDMDDYSDSDNDDDIEATLYEYLAGKMNVKQAAEEIFTMMADGHSGNVSFTTRDPRQMSFDFDK